MRSTRAEDGEALLARETLYQGRPITVAQGMLHGPVWIGVLAGCRLLGEDRLLPAARLVVALLLGLLAAATTALAARLGAPPLATGLALAFAPGPLLLAGTAMTDLPMLALLCRGTFRSCCRRRAAFGPAAGCSRFPRRVGGIDTLLRRGGRPAAGGATVPSSEPFASGALSLPHQRVRGCAHGSCSRLCGWVRRTQHGVLRCSRSYRTSIGW